MKEPWYGAFSKAYETGIRETMRQFMTDQGLVEDPRSKLWHCAPECACRKVVKHRMSLDAIPDRLVQDSKDGGVSAHVAMIRASRPPEPVVEE